MSQPDLMKLALQSQKVVHGLEFPEQEDFQGQREILTTLIDQLQRKYAGDQRVDELLFDAWAEVVRQPTDRLAMFRVTREIIRFAREAAKGSSTAVPVKLEPLGLAH